MSTGLARIGGVGGTQMSDQTPPTDGQTEQQNDSTAERKPGSSNRILFGRAPLHEPLPGELATRLGRVLDRDPIPSIATWVDDLRDLTGGGAIAEDDLCHAAEETEHRGRLDGEVYHFQCFYDGVVLAALADGPVDLRTVSPEGEEITATAVGSTDLSVTPSESVFSFGIDAEVSRPTDGPPSHEDIYSAVCPYVRAFPDRSSYLEWQNRVEAETVAMPLAGATDLAAALVGSA